MQSLYIIYIPTVQQRHENGNKNESDPLTRVSSNSIERGGAIVQKVAKAKSKKKGKDSLRLSAASEEIDASADPNDMKFYYSKTPQKNFNPKKLVHSIRNKCHPQKRFCVYVRCFINLY